MRKNQRCERRASCREEIRRNTIGKPNASLMPRMPILVLTFKVSAGNLPLGVFFSG